MVISVFPRYVDNLLDLWLSFVIVRLPGDPVLRLIVRFFNGLLPRSKDWIINHQVYLLIVTCTIMQELHTFAHCHEISVMWSCLTIHWKIWWCILHCDDECEDITMDDILSCERKLIIHTNTCLWIVITIDMSNTRVFILCSPIVYHAIHTVYNARRGWQIHRRIMGTDSRGTEPTSSTCTHSRACVCVEREVSQHAL